MHTNRDKPELDKKLEPAATTTAAHAAPAKVETDKQRKAIA